VLRAAEIDGDWLDGAVAVAPNIWAGAPARPLYDVATEAALLMPCALAAEAFDREPLARPGGSVPAAGWQRCASLHADGLLQAGTPATQATEALARLRDGGWTDAALASGALSVGFDLWRAVTAAYAAAYSRSGSGPMPCGYGYAMVDDSGQPRAPSVAEVALWWSDSAGIPPGAGVALTDALATGDDPSYPGLRCLRRLWLSDDDAGRRLRAGVDATRAAPPAAGLPLVVIHGLDDGLVPEAHTAGPYVAKAQAAGRAPVYWQIEHVQHFDAFLGAPALASRYLPLMPYAWHALDAMWTHLHDGAAIPPSTVVRPRRRAVDGGRVEPLSGAHLALPGRADVPMPAR
jgi:hydroxybutyrate-dimer hydrolase